MKTRLGTLARAAALCAGFATFINGLPASAQESSSVELRLVASEFVSPVAMAEFADASGTVLIADQAGVIYRLTKGKATRDVYLDLRKRMVSLNEGFDERGLLGLALHPRFEQNRKLYVCYSAPLRGDAPQDWNHTSRLSEFQADSKSGLTLDPASEKTILEIDNPFFNHNGGSLAFGPDGFLYIAVGDGGAANDQGKRPAIGNGQDPQTLLGSILRIDVDAGEPYDIPDDNPFADGKNGRPEIFAYGFRNPWRISFDRGGENQLFAADVGQNLFEEVNIVERGGNYGWRIREGFHCFDPSNPRSPSEDCPKTGRGGEPLLDPILEYKNANGFRGDPEALGISVTGGFVYRGKALPDLQGSYIFGDWSKDWGRPQGTLLAARPPNSRAPDRRWSVRPLTLRGSPSGMIDEYIVGFGQDIEGELYVMTSGRNSVTGTTGKVFKLVPARR